MFNKVLVFIFFCSVIISCKDEPRPSSKLDTLPLTLAKNKSATAIGSSIDGKIIVLNTGTGDTVEPCQEDKNNSNKRTSTCETTLYQPSKIINSIIDSTRITHPVSVIKDGKIITAKLSLIATITYQDKREIDINKKGDVSFLDSIVSNAYAQSVTVDEYCTSIYSAGTKRQTCISLGDDCVRWKGVWGEAVVLNAIPACIDYF